MDPRPVACAALDVDLAAPHGVPKGVSCVAVDHDPAGVLGIPHCILGIALDDHGSAVQICPHGVARGAVDGNGLVRCAAADEPFPEAVVDLDLSGGMAHSFVQLFISKLFCRKCHFSRPPNITFRSAWLNAISSGSRHSRSKSTLLRGVRLRIIAV